jgi:uridylate kinase
MIQIPNADAKIWFYFDDVIKKRIERNGSLRFTLSQENKLPIVIFDMNKEGNFEKICEGENIGTVVNI